MSYKFVSSCPLDGGSYRTVESLAEHILSAHMPRKCPHCRTAWTGEMIDSWVYEVPEGSSSRRTEGWSAQMLNSVKAARGAPILEYFVRCQKCNSSWTLIAQTYDDKGNVVGFCTPRDQD